MSNSIHPTAIISDQVKLGSGNIIGPYVIMEGEIELGDNNKVGPGCIFKNTVEIGSDNLFKAYVSVGLEGEMGTKGDRLMENGKVSIGNANVIREFVTIHAPVRRQETRIENQTYLMSRCHVAHDCIVNDFVILATNSVLGGGVTVAKKAYVGLGSITHQWLDIGEYAMIGMNAVNTQSVLPFAKMAGVPSRIIGLNTVGAERNDLSKEMEAVEEIGLEKLLMGDALQDNPIAKSIRNFVANCNNLKLKFK